MKLFEIDESLRDLLVSYELLIESEEPDETAIRDLAAHIADLQVERDRKVASFCAALKNTDADIVAVTAAIKDLQSRKKNLERKSEGLRNLIKLAIPEGAKWSHGVHAVGWRRSEFVDDHSPTLIPDIYWTPQPPKLNKESVERDLKSGATIPGVQMGTRQNLQVK